MANGSMPLRKVSVPKQAVMYQPPAASATAEATCGTPAAWISAISAARTSA